MDYLGFFSEDSYSSLKCTVVSDITLVTMLFKSPLFTVYFDWSLLGSRKILSNKRKLPVGGSVKLGKVARRFTHFRMVYAI